MHCEKEKDIERLIKTVFGNGEKGVTQLLATVAQQLDHNNEAIEDLKKSVDKHTKTLAQMGGFQEGSAKGKIIVRWLIGLSVALFSVVISMGAIIINLT